MSSEWKDCSVGDVITLKRGYDLPKAKRQNGSVPLVSSAGISDFISQVKVKGPGVVTGRYGTIGNVYFIKDDFFPLNTTLYVQDFKGNNERFISYFLLTIDFWSCSDKAAVPGVNRNHIHMLRAKLPPLNEQKAIASILGTIDEKIELNKKTNETLEGIAKALFQSWFVDFDPVKAKKEGLPTGLPDEISDLFPNSFEDCESGLIPTGWKISHVGDLVKNINRGISPKYTNQKEYPVINQKCIRDSQINFSLCKFTEYKRNMEAKFLSNFDVLVNSMGVGTLGRVALFVNHDKNILVDGCVTFVRGKTDVYSLFIFQILLRREKEIINLSTGSTGQTSLSKESLLNMNFIKPKEEILERYSFFIKDLYIQRNNNIIQNNHLMRLRDTLLPKLISGELRIPDAEKIIEEEDL